MSLRSLWVLALVVTTSPTPLPSVAPTSTPTSMPTLSSHRSCACDTRNSVHGRGGWCNRWNQVRRRTPSKCCTSKCCTAVWMGGWVYGCMSVWVYGCMGTGCGCTGGRRSADVLNDLSLYVFDELCAVWLYLHQADHAWCYVSKACPVATRKTSEPTAGMTAGGHLKRGRTAKERVLAFKRGRRPVTCNPKQVRPFNALLIQRTAHFNGIAWQLGV
jgi:hypothetical protein